MRKDNIKNYLNRQAQAKFKSEMFSSNFFPPKLDLKSLAPIQNRASVTQINISSIKFMTSRSPLTLH